MKLMLVQLQNQDPTNPTSDFDQILKMATFGILEGVNKLSDTLANERTNLFEYNKLMGNEVTYEIKEDDEENRVQKVITKKGIVQGAFLHENKIMLDIEGDIVVPNQIQSMNIGKIGKPLLQDNVQYLSLVGKKASYTVTEPGTGNEQPTVTSREGVISSVALKNGIIEFTINGEKVTLDKINGISYPPENAGTTS